MVAISVYAELFRHMEEQQFTFWHSTRALGSDGIQEIQRIVPRWREG